MEQFTTISVINVLPSTKEEVRKFCQDAKQRILAGEENPLKIAAQLKSFEEVIEKLRGDDEIKAAFLNELFKHGKSVQMFNSEFTAKEVGVKYDFSVCDDKTWSELDAKIKELTEKKKERETFLKTIKNDVFDPNGIQLIPPIKTSTTQVTVKLLNYD
jgi:hypothetical protein